MKTKPPPATPRRSPSARARILGWYVILLALSLLAALLLQRAFLLVRVSHTADEALDQAVAELRQLAGGLNPATGEPFGTDAAAVFDLFLDRNVPFEDEAVVTIVEGRLYRADEAGAVLAAPALIDQWLTVDAPLRRQVATPDGSVRYLAVPVQGADGQTHAVFVVAILMAERVTQANETVRLGALVYGSIFLIASALAWFAAGGVLRPLRQLADTARAIGEHSWSARIPVKGNDEIAELGRTFNSMLDRLDSAFAAQRQFVDDAGHELRTPITVIRGHLELMGEDPDERSATVALVTDELDRMTRIVDDLLVLAKYEQPDFVIAHPLDLGELTRELAMKGATLSERVWTVEEVADVVITADHDRLTQAMMNLMRNAIEHTPLTAELAIGSRLEGPEARIWVQDTGPGIPADEQERIFTRFARGSGGRRPAAGAGLGLAIVRSIAEAHHGRVEVHSQPGEGSVFTLVLPADSLEVTET